MVYDEYACYVLCLTPSGVSDSPSVCTPFGPSVSSSCSTFLIHAPMAPLRLSAWVLKMDETTDRKPSCRKKHARMVPFDQKRIAYDRVEMVDAWPKTSAPCPAERG